MATASDYDLFKKMLDITRNKLKLNEQLNTNTLQPTELEDEKKKFLEAVGGNVEFGEFKIYEDNIEFSGILNNDRIRWNFSLDSTVGCYISSENTQLTDETVSRLQKLKAYYDVWSAYWTNEISM